MYEINMYKILDEGFFFQNPYKNIFTYDFMQMSADCNGQWDHNISLTFLFKFEILCIN